MKIKKTMNKLEDRLSFGIITIESAFAPLYLPTYVRRITISNFYKEQFKENPIVPIASMVLGGGIALGTLAGLYLGEDYSQYINPNIIQEIPKYSINEIKNVITNTGLVTNGLSFLYETLKSKKG